VLLAGARAAAKAETSQERRPRKNMMGPSN
jgi:hypothetical protein